MITQNGVKLIEATQKLAFNLRRTGTVLIVLVAVAAIAVNLDFPGNDIVGNVALSLILANGIALQAQASVLLRTIDKGLVEILRTRRNG